MNKSHLTITTGILGLSLGLIINTETRNFGVFTTILGVGSLGVSMMVNPASKKDDPRELRTELNKAQTELRTLSAKLNTVESKETSARQELGETKQKLGTAIEVLKTCESERLQGLETIESLNQELMIKAEKIRILELNVETLQDEVDEWDASFETQLEKKFQDALRTRIKQIESENDAITREAIELCKQYREWADKAASRNVERGDFVRDITKTYSNKISEVQTNWDKTISEYLTQIEILNNKVAMLQQKLACVMNGDLTEPAYLEVGFSPEGRIGNAICEWVWTRHQIALAVKGYESKKDGSVDVAYGYSRLIPTEALTADLNRFSGEICKALGIHKITNVRKLEIADLIVVTFRREPAVKEDSISLLAGTSEEFKKYLKSNPWRYRLIAEPGTGKTPITAVMVSVYLEAGMTLGNTGRGKKIPLADVIVSCPDVQSSQKDIDYPLQPFLKYGDTTAANKSFVDAYQEWEYRKQNTLYAKEISSLWVWDELDVTINSASDPKATGERLKKLLKQAHHTGMGWIASGQSVMTKQIPGFMDDDRDLFTELIIGVSKIRKYLEKYGKRYLSEKIVKSLLSNLDDLETYIEDKNSQITDTARLIRLALVLDQKAPKLYFMPNLDDVDFSFELIEKTEQAKRHLRTGKVVIQSDRTDHTIAETIDIALTDRDGSEPSNRTIEGKSQSSHCPHCGSSDLSILKDGRYRCKNCSKRFVESKVVWK